MGKAKKRVHYEIEFMSPSREAWRRLAGGYSNFKKAKSAMGRIVKRDRRLGIPLWKYRVIRVESVETVVATKGGEKR